MEVRTGGGITTAGPAGIISESDFKKKKVSKQLDAGEPGKRLNRRNERSKQESGLPTIFSSKRERIRRLKGNIVTAVSATRSSSNNLAARVSSSNSSATNKSHAENSNESNSSSCCSSCTANSISKGGKSRSSNPPRSKLNFYSVLAALECEARRLNLVQREKEQVTLKLPNSEINALGALIDELPQSISDRTCELSAPLCSILQTRKPIISDVLALTNEEDDKLHSESRPLTNVAAKFKWLGQKYPASAPEFQERPYPPSTSQQPLYAEAVAENVQGAAAELKDRGSYSTRQAIPQQQCPQYVMGVGVSTQAQRRGDPCYFACPGTANVDPGPSFRCVAVPGVYEDEEKNLVHVGGNPQKDISAGNAGKATFRQRNQQAEDTPVQHYVPNTFDGGTKYKQDKKYFLHAFKGSNFRKYGFSGDAGLEKGGSVKAAQGIDYEPLREGTRSCRLPSPASNPRALPVHAATIDSSPASAPVTEKGFRVTPEQQSERLSAYTSKTVLPYLLQRDPPAAVYTALDEKEDTDDRRGNSELSSAVVAPIPKSRKEQTANCCNSRIQWEAKHYCRSPQRVSTQSRCTAFPHLPSRRKDCSEYLTGSEESLLHPPFNCNSSNFHEGINARQSHSCISTPSAAAVASQQPDNTAEADPAVAGVPGHQGKCCICTEQGSNSSSTNWDCSVCKANSSHNTGRSSTEPCFGCPKWCSSFSRSTSFGEDEEASSSTSITATSKTTENGTTPVTEAERCGSNSSEAIGRTVEASTTQVPPCCSGVTTTNTPDIQQLLQLQQRGQLQGREQEDTLRMEEVHSGTCLEEPADAREEPQERQKQQQWLLQQKQRGKKGGENEEKVEKADTLSGSQSIEKVEPHHPDLHVSEKTAEASFEVAPLHLYLENMVAFGSDHLLFNCISPTTNEKHVFCIDRLKLLSFAAAHLPWSSREKRQQRQQKLKENASIVYSEETESADHQMEREYEKTQLRPIDTQTNSINCHTRSIDSNCSSKGNTTTYCNSVGSSRKVDNKYFRSGKDEAKVFNERDEADYKRLEKKRMRPESEWKESTRTDVTKTNSESSALRKTQQYVNLIHGVRSQQRDCLRSNSQTCNPSASQQKLACVQSVESVSHFQASQNISSCISNSSTGSSCIKSGDQVKDTNSNDSDSATDSSTKDSFSGANNGRDKRYLGQRSCRNISPRHSDQYSDLIDREEFTCRLEEEIRDKLQQLTYREEMLRKREKALERANGIWSWTPVRQETQSAGLAKRTDGTGEEVHLCTPTDVELITLLEKENLRNSARKAEWELMKAIIEVQELSAQSEESRGILQKEFFERKIRYLASLERLRPQLGLAYDELHAAITDCRTLGQLSTWIAAFEFPGADKASEARAAAHLLQNLDACTAAAARSYKAAAAAAAAYNEVAGDMSVSPPCENSCRSCMSRYSCSHYAKVTSHSPFLVKSGMDNHQLQTCIEPVPSSMHTQCSSGTPDQVATTSTWLEDESPTKRHFKSEKNSSKLSPNHLSGGEKPSESATAPDADADMKSTDVTERVAEKLRQVGAYSSACTSAASCSARKSFPSDKKSEGLVRTDSQLNLDSVGSERGAKAVDKLAQCCFSGAAEGNEERHIVIKDDALAAVTAENKICCCSLCLNAKNKYSRCQAEGCTNMQLHVPGDSNGYTLAGKQHSQTCTSEKIVPVRSTESGEGILQDFLKKTVEADADAGLVNDLTSIEIISKCCYEPSLGTKCRSDHKLADLQKNTVENSLEKVEPCKTSITSPVSTERTNERHTHKFLHKLPALADLLDDAEAISKPAFSNAMNKESHLPLVQSSSLAKIIDSCTTTRQCEKNTKSQICAVFPPSLSPLPQRKQTDLQQLPRGTAFRRPRLQQQGSRSLFALPDMRIARHHVPIYTSTNDCASITETSDSACVAADSESQCLPQSRSIQGHLPFLTAEASVKFVASSSSTCQSKRSTSLGFPETVFAGVESESIGQTRNCKSCIPVSMLPHSPHRTRRLNNEKCFHIRNDNSTYDNCISSEEQREGAVHHSIVRAAAEANDAAVSKKTGQLSHELGRGSNFLVKSTSCEKLYADDADEEQGVQVRHECSATTATFKDANGLEVENFDYSLVEQKNAKHSDGASYAKIHEKKRSDDVDLRQEHNCDCRLASVEDKFNLLNTPDINFTLVNSGSCGSVHERKSSYLHEEKADSLYKENESNNITGNKLEKETVPICIVSTDNGVENTKEMQKRGSTKASSSVKRAMCCISRCSSLRSVTSTHSDSRMGEVSAHSPVRKRQHIEMCFWDRRWRASWGGSTPAEIAEEQRETAAAAALREVSNRLVLGSIGYNCSRASSVAGSRFHSRTTSLSGAEVISRRISRSVSIGFAESMNSNFSTYVVNAADECQMFDWLGHDDFLLQSRLRRIICGTQKDTS